MLCNAQHVLFGHFFLFEPTSHRKKRIIASMLLYTNVTRLEPILSYLSYLLPSFKVRVLPYLSSNVVNGRSDPPMGEFHTCLFVV